MKQIYLLSVILSKTTRDARTETYKEEGTFDVVLFLLRKYKRK
jgi:hypothetical protein